MFKINNKDVITISTDDFFVFIVDSEQVSKIKDFEMVCRYSYVIDQFNVVDFFL